jgi:hypothetical protein
MTARVPKKLAYTVAADTVTVSADISGMNQVCAILRAEGSEGSTGSINLVLQTYDSTSASNGTSLTTIWGTNQMTAQLTAGAKDFMAVANVNPKGRYLYVSATQADETSSVALVVLGLGLNEDATNATDANVTKFAQT